MLKNKFIAVQKNTLELIKSEEKFWVLQRSHLMTHHKMVEEFQNQVDFDNLTIQDLKKIEDIKTFRTHNLNTLENVHDIRYADKVAGLMCEIKVLMMTSLLY